MRRSPPMALERITDPRVIARFLRSVELEGECWVWTGHTDRKGYGQFWFDGRAHWAHRVAFAMFRGRIPTGMTIHHTCHLSSCVNPHHLELATLEENGRDGAARRRR